MQHALAALSLLALSGGASAYVPVSGAFAPTARTVPAAPARVCVQTDSRGMLVRGRGLRLGTSLHECTPLSAARSQPPGFRPASAAPYWTTAKTGTHACVHPDV